MGSRRILVTGGAGFIGSHYVRTLLAADDGPHLTVLDKLTYAGSLSNLSTVREHPRLAFVRGDVCDGPTVDRLIADHPEVVHLAAESHVDRSIDQAGAFVRTNALGTFTLLDAMLRHHGDRGVFVHVSTDEVYGSVPDGSSLEDHALVPSSPYSASKASGDLLALAFHHTHGLDVRVTRCSNNYGPRQHPEKLIPLVITNLLDGGEAPIYGDGGNVRDWLHVADHVRGIELVRRAGRAGQVYNIGGGCELTNLEVARRLVRLAGLGEDRIRLVADRRGHDRRYSVDYRKAHDELGYRPCQPFDTGLAETFAWYRDNRGWWTVLKRPAAALTAG